MEIIRRTAKSVMLHLFKDPIHNLRCEGPEISGQGHSLTASREGHSLKLLCSWPYGGAILSDVALQIFLLEAGREPLEAMQLPEVLPRYGDDVINDFTGGGPQAHRASRV